MWFAACSCEVIFWLLLHVAYCSLCLCLLSCWGFGRAANHCLCLWWEVPVTLPVLGGGPLTLELILAGAAAGGCSGRLFRVSWWQQWSGGGLRQCQGWGTEGEGSSMVFAASLGCIVCAWQRVSCCSDPAVMDFVGVQLSVLWLELCSEGHMGWQSQPGFFAQGWCLESQVDQIGLQTNFPRALSVLCKQ